jgi:hypothetical protein
VRIPITKVAQWPWSVASGSPTLQEQTLCAPISALRKDFG